MVIRCLRLTRYAVRYDTTVMLSCGRREKFRGGVLSCTERTSQEKEFEVTLTVKMETRHPIVGKFGSEFSAICNRCGVMAA